MIETFDKEKHTITMIAKAVGIMVFILGIIFYIQNQIPYYIEMA